MAMMMGRMKTDSNILFYHSTTAVAQPRHTDTCNEKGQRAQGQSGATEVGVEKGGVGEKLRKPNTIRRSVTMLG
jgi:hypothetical protein